MGGHSDSEEEHDKSTEKTGNKKKLPALLRVFFHDDANIKKLITRDDPEHIHKTLGILALLSFIYRYGYLYPKTGNLGFNGGSVFNWVSMGIHTLLAFSAIIFRVPAKRIDHKPMVIYEEYRQHAMVFTLRCFSLYTAVTLFPDSPAWFNPLLVAAHHLFADDITRRHGSGNTAVRAISDKLETSSFYQKVARLYSFYQFLAIGSHICPNPYLADLAFNAIIAIQSSAFMMTLYRKRIVRGRTHMAVYSLCLLLSAFHIVRLIGLKRTLLVMATFALRINLPRQLSNKYVLWAMFATFPHAVSYLVANNAEALGPALPLLSQFSAENIAAL